MVFAPKKNVLAIDQEQAKKQLVLLGYKPGDNVYLTAFFPKGDPRTKGVNRDKGRKAERLNYSEVETWQAEGRGVYLVVNGYGHGKDDVKNCRAIFYEHDDLDKDVQLTLWQSLGLPEPTVQVDTGGKSIHSYWVFDQPIHPELWAFDEGKGNWKGLQADLLKFANADKSLVNPNRVMRLAGCWYMVNDDSGTHAVAQSRIVGGCEQKYSYKELRGIIPRSEPPEVKPEKRSHPNISQETGEGLLDFRTVGHLLPHWNNRGRSDWATFQCPVHTSSGKHSDDHIHVNLSTGEWKAHCGCDCKLIYQAVCEMTGHKQKPTGRGYSNGISGGNRRNFGDGSGGSGGDGGDGNQPLTVLSLRERILEILNRNQNRSRRDEAFINLAQTTQATVREIKELAASLETEVDLEESRSDRKAEVENLLKIGKYQLALQDYLDPSVAHPLERIAGWMGTTPAAMLTTLYPVIGSLLQVGTRLELIKATDFYAVPVLYAGLVCESGGGKSPTQKTIINPLFALQDEAEIKHKERLKEYQQELSDWKKIKDNEEPAPEQPVPREYYTTDATSEAIALIQSQQPNHGFLGWFDELPALFKSQGQYKNGRGADGEKILSGRDGTGFKVNRASGKRLVVSQSAYSITGSLQPLILRQMMGDFTDANGQWARFLWTVMQVQPAPYPDDAIPFDVFGLLKGIYRRISKLAPQTYKLSSKAQKLYRNWYNNLDQLKMSESRQGLRAVFSKMKSDTGVLALLLHCFNGCVNEGSLPDLEVSESTMAAAIKLAKYHIGQVKLIHSEGDAANGELAAIHAKIIQLSERKGWLKAADVRDIDRQTKKQFSANDIRRHFQELETSGFGQTKGESTKLMWSINKEDGSPTSGGNSGQTSPNSGHLPKNSGSASTREVQPFVEKNGCQTQDNSGQTQDKLKPPGSITNTGIQLTENETQDIQDSFVAQDPPLVEHPHSGNEIKDAAPTFDVLSCPEFVSESHNTTPVGIPAQDKTQGNCPETVLSCPELLSNASKAIAPPPAAEAVADEQTPQSTGLPLYQRSDGGFELQSFPVITAAACTITVQDTIDALASAETLAELGAVGNDQIAAVWGQLTSSTRIKILQLTGQLAEGRECVVLHPFLKQQWVDARIVKVIPGAGWKVLYGGSREFAVWNINSIRPKSDG